MKADTSQIEALGPKINLDQDAANAAQALVSSLGAMALRTKTDSDKSATLLAEGVISANESGRSLEATICRRKASSARHE